VGSLLGYPLVVKALMYTALIGGMMAVVVLIWRRVPAGRIAARLGAAGTEGDQPAEPAAAPGPTTVPYGFAIIGGCLVTFLVGAYG